ncbi:MAG: hypothetical protein NTU49_06580 [Gammaproteobacteria bacterium]|nr:hypothetical protein [Gammaproteobacteria bacterium]
MKKSAALLITLSTVSTISFGLTLHSMTKTQVKNAFVNKTLVTIPTANLNGKTINNVVTVFMDSKGHIFGKMARKPENAPQTDHGIYQIKNNGTLDITWQHWDMAKKIHAHFFNTKNAYIAIDNDTVFHTAFMKAQIQPGNHLQ